MGKIIDGYYEISDKLTKSLLKNICQEHSLITKVYDNSLNYLWYMYNKGSRKGDFNPFIIMAEINLLEYMKMLEEEETNNMLKQLMSSDSENLYMLLLAVESLRNKRIKKFKEYREDNVNYKNINYKVDIFKKDQVKTFYNEDFKKNI